MSLLRFTSAASLVTLFITLGACGGGSDNTTGTAGSTSSGTGGAGGGGTGGGAGAGVPFETAAHADLPQVISLGGSVIAAPKVQPIVYAGDPHTADLEAFLKELTQTSYWSQTTSEYGVGALTVLPTIVRPEAAPSTISDSTLVSDLSANLGATWGAPDGDTIYLFVFPTGTKVNAGGLCCDSFDGYHDEAKASGVKIPYGVVCSCPGLDGPGVSDVQQITIAASHELIEAATDPFPYTDPAFGQNDDANVIWTLATGGEAADMCEFDLDSFVIPQGSTYMVQKSWSNVEAKAGREPCLPATGAPFFAASPVLPDMLSITGVPFKTSGVKLAVGETKTIDVQLWSNKPTSGPFKVNVYDLSSDFYGDSQALQVSLDKNTGMNGDVLKLTINMVKVDTTMGVNAFVLETELDGETSLVMGAVNTK